MRVRTFDFLFAVFESKMFVNFADVSVKICIFVGYRGVIHGKGWGALAETIKRLVL